MGLTLDETGRRTARTRQEIEKLRDIQLAELSNYEKGAEW